MFPYISIYNYFASGIQIYPFIICSIYLILNSCKNIKVINFKKNDALIISLLVIIYIKFIFFSNFDNQELRILFAFSSFFVFYIYGIYYFKKNIQSSEYLFLFGLIVYFVCALIQYFVDANYFSFISSREYAYDKIDGRGVESITPEPTFFALINFYIYYIIVIYVKPTFKTSLLSTFLYISNLLLSLSSTVIISSVIAFIFLIPKKILLILIIFLYVVLQLFSSLLIFEDYSETIRVNKLIIEIIKSMNNVHFDTISGLININDLSLVDRVNHILFSFYMGYNNILGNPLDSWCAFIDQSNINYITCGGPQPFSFFGAITFFCGIAGYLFFISFYTNFIKNKSNYHKYLSILLALLLIQCNSIALPIIGFIYGLNRANSKT
jgi:hypothetical protein